MVTSACQARRRLCAIAMPGTASMPANRLPAQVRVHRCGLHSQAGCLPFTLYPAMPGNSTAYPREKWEVQRPAMAAAVGQEAADRRFQGATRCGMGSPGLLMDGSCTRLGWKVQAPSPPRVPQPTWGHWNAAQLVCPSLPSISPPSNPARGTQSGVPRHFAGAVCARAAAGAHRPAQGAANACRTCWEGR